MTKKQTNHIDRVIFGISYFLRFLILAEALAAAWNKNLLVLVISAGILLLTFIPSFIERNYKIRLPTEFELLVVIFISFSLFLGEVKDFYTRFWWWDSFLHSLSGILLGFAGFLVVYIMYSERKVRTSPRLAMFFSFCFALAIGALWEIVEFILDGTLGLHMQESGLVDTMWDLIVDSIGAFLVSVSGYFYLKRQKRLGFFERGLRRFMERNPHLFRRH